LNKFAQFPSIFSGLSVSSDLISLDRPSLGKILSKWGVALYQSQRLDADSILHEMFCIGDLLGKRVLGRQSLEIEVLRPLTIKDAHPRSLSAQYGLAELPFHVELSHRPRPCRYLIMGCLEPGRPSAVTKLLDWRALELTSNELNLLETAPVFVRSGRQSFYSTILSRGHEFLRYDPGCIEAVDSRGESALALMKRHIASWSSAAHEWQRGSILIIDNWRLLHSRGAVSARSERRLARVLIDDQ